LNLWNSKANYKGYKIGKNAFSGESGDITRNHLHVFSFLAIIKFQKKDKLNQFKEELF
jgi:hypothetical protein